MIDGFYTAEEIKPLLGSPDSFGVFSCSFSF